MSFSSRFRSYFTNLLYGKERPLLRRLHGGLTSRRSPRIRLLVEMLEDRTVLSTLPPAVVGSTALNLETLAGAAGRANSIGPNVVVDPLDASKIVEVHTTFHTNTVPQQWIVEGDFSRDEGRTWNFFTVATPLADPALVATPFVEITDPAIAYDRNHHFYVVESQHNSFSTGTTSGALVFQRFDFSGNSPVRDNSLGAGTPNPGNLVLDRWFNQDPAVNPTIGIDTNVPSFTDPVTGRIQTDSMATMVSIPATPTYPADIVPKGIYVAWNVNQTFPQPPVTLPPQPLESRIFMVASADGGRNFTTQELVSDLLHRQGGAIPQTGTQASSPQIIFSQGTGDGRVPGGQVMVFYNDFYTNINQYFYDVTTPDGGVAATPVAAAKVFSNNTQMTIVDGIPNQGGPDLPGITNDLINVDFNAVSDINTRNLTSVVDLMVTVSLVHPDLDQLSLVLVPPNGLPQVTLLRNRVDGAGMTIMGAPPAPYTGTVAVGLPAGGTSIGSVRDPSTAWKAVGTVFDDFAPRAITDPMATAPFVGHYRPESGSLRALINSPNFLTRATGQWSLRAIDTRNSGTPPPPQFIQSWSLNFTGRIAVTTGTYPGGTPAGTSGFGPPGSDVPVKDSFGNQIRSQLLDTTVAPNQLITIPGNALNNYPTKTAVAPASTPGIGPIFSVAIDNTLGSFSPFQGRVYFAWTVPSRVALGGVNKSNVEMVVSDNVTGSTLDAWTTSPGTFTTAETVAYDGLVNRDAPGDNFTEGSRAQFNPKVAVDPVTGTLGVTFYDGKYDAQHVRIANAFTTSIDGGVTFAPDVFLNTQKTATDFYTGATVFLEPTPDNLAVAGPFGFGDSTGLAMYGGRVYPVWSGNSDLLPSTNPLVPFSVIFTNTVTVAGGPRVVNGDMGPVVNDFITGGASYNNTFTADWTRQLNGFVITFDRPIDPGLVTPGSVNITYRDPNTPAGQPGVDLSNQIISTNPIDVSTPHGPNDPGTRDSVSISDTIVHRPQSGQVFAVFTVTMSQTLGTLAAFDWATQDGTGSGAAVSTGNSPDYQASRGTVIIPAGETTASFQVPIFSNGAGGGNKFFLVNLSNAPGNVIIHKSQGRGTIIDSQILPSITVGNAYVQKGPNGPPGTVNPVINFPVYLNAPAATNVSVDFSFTDGTARQGVDYTGTPGTLTILAGNTTGIITLTPPQIHAVSNQNFTGNRSFFLNLTNPVNASVTRSQAIGVIVDTNALRVSAGDLTVQRTAAPQVVNVTFYLSGTTNQDVTVNYATQNGTATAPADYTSVTNGSVTIPAGSQSVTVPVTIAGSTTASVNKNFQVRITGVTNASAMAANSAATITIVDSNTVPALVIGDLIGRQSITGTNPTYNVPVYLTFANPTPITLTYQTVNAGTNPATPGTDYVAIPAGTTVTIPAGTTVFNIPVQFIGNLLPEVPVNPTFGLQITGVTTGNATVARNLGVVTIVSDYVLLSVGDVTVRESSTGNVNAAFQVFLSGPSELPITADVALVNQTAVSGLDFAPLLPTQTTVTFNPGQTVQTVNVTVLHNPAGNPVPNTFLLQATAMTVGGVAAPAALIEKPNGQGRIVDVDNTTNTFWDVGDFSAFEGNVGLTTFNVPLILNQPFGAAQTVTVNTAGGAGRINPLVNVTITVPAGASVVSIPVQVIGNIIPQPNLAFTVTISAPSSGVIQRNVGTVTIIDDDATTVNIGSAIGFVGQNLVTSNVFNFPVVISNASPTAVAGNYSTADGSATVAENDYGPIVASPFTNLPGPSDTLNLPVSVTGSVTPEFNHATLGYETFTASLGNTSVFSFPAQTTATAYMVDTNLLNLSVGDASVAEGSAVGAMMNLNVYLNGVSGADVTFTWTLVDGTAHAGVDFSGPVTGTGTITAGSLFTTISVPLTSDAVFDGNKAFTLAVSNPVGAGIQKGSGTGTIVDTNGTPTLSVSDAVVVKQASGQQTAQFTVFADYPVASPTTVTVTPGDLTATAAENDYVATPITVTLPAGATSTTFNVAINGDNNAEGNETFKVTLSNPSGGDLLAPRVADQDPGAPGEGIGTIVDFHTLTSVNVGDLVVKQGFNGQQTQNVSLVLTAPSPVPITLQVDTVDGTATAANHDYLPIVGLQVTIPANNSTWTIPVTVFGSSFLQGDRSFGIRISNATNATINKDRGTITIIDPNSVLGATQFFVKFTPQHAVGTYSYTVSPLMADRIRVPFIQANPLDPSIVPTVPIAWQGTVPEKIIQGLTVPAQRNVPINTANPNPYVATSTIDLTGQVDPAQVLRDLTVTVNALYPDTSHLTVTLTAPGGGPTFTLSNTAVLGANFPNTVFDDQALTSIISRATSNVQTITVDATGGSFAVSFNGSTTPQLAWNATAQVVQSALEALLGAGNVTVTLTGNVYTLVLVGFPTNPPLVTTDSTQLSGNTHSAVVAPVITQGQLTSFRPVTPLSAVALPASQLNGVWTLRITNMSTSLFGTLTDWSLRLQTGLPSSTFTPRNPTYKGSLGNFVNQMQNSFTASLARDPTDIFGIPTPLGGVPLRLPSPFASPPAAPFLSPPYDPATLPLIIPGPHQDVIKYTTFDAVQTINFNPAVVGGTFKLTFNGSTTNPIPWSIVPATLQANLQAALNVLPTIGPGNTAVSVSPNPAVTFQGALSGPNIPTMTFDATGLLGGGIDSIVTSSVGTPANPLNILIPEATLIVPTHQSIPSVTDIPLVVANAPTDRILTGLTVRVGIQHSTAQNLRLTLIAPDGTQVLLSNQNGVAGGNYDSTVFDDSAATSITAASAPFQGTFAPQVPLSTFNGKNINGAWKLRVENMLADGVHGQVLYWQLIPTSDLLLNKTNSYVDFAFDRKINLSTIDVSNLSNVLGPTGLISSQTQTVAVDATGGTFTISYRGNSTVPLAYNASAQTVQNALQALPVIGAGNVTVSLGNGNVYTLTFALPNPPQVTADFTLLTGNTATATVGPFSIIPNPTVPGSSPAVAVYPPEFRDRVFRITFPVQQLSGSYSLVVGPVNNAVNPALNKTITDLAGNAIDNNLNAGLYVLQGANPTNAGTGTHSYTTPTINQTFAPGGAASSTIVVADDFIITQDALNHIQLQLTVNHQNIPDLVGTLTAPDGTVVNLFTNDGIFGAVAGQPHPNMANTLFDDSASFAPIQNAAAPVGTGPFKPVTPLSNLVGKNARGIWTLTITNQTRNAANAYSLGTFTGTLVQWSLALPFTTPGTGLGETGADQQTVRFRIFTQDPSNPLSSSVWTAIGPASAVGPTPAAGAGRVGAVAVDPADTTGNTVYAAGAKGGVWKTYNFLTQDPKGPNWIPLTDLGPLNSLNIGTLAAIASPDGDPNKTLVLAGTGETTTTTFTSNTRPITNTGIGFLRSPDGGRTWQVIDSTNANVTVTSSGVETALPINSPQRNHLFAGTAVNRIVIDPTQLNGKFVIYAAIDGTSAANSGIFRSLDSGLTWTPTPIESGRATDVVLAPGSAGGGTGQLQVLYAGFMTGFGRTGGVYFTSSAPSASSLLPVPDNGSGQPGPNQGVNSRENESTNPPTIVTVGPSNNPSGTTTPVILAMPGKTNKTLQDALFQGWVYAYTNNNLYETKDFGQNWTQVNLPLYTLPLNPFPVFPSNDTTRPGFPEGEPTAANPFIGATSLVVDPNNPNVVFIGGKRVVRVDLTNVSDVYSFVNFDFSDPTGTTTQTQFVGDAIGDANGAPGVLNAFNPFLPVRRNVLNMLRDPSNPFLAPSSLQFLHTTNFRNDGSDIKWQFFDLPLPQTPITYPGNVQEMIGIKDPITGNVRLIYGTTTGIYTAVDQGEANFDPGIGTAAVVNGSRQGNLQIGQITSTGVQPSTLAASVSGALLFAENPGVGLNMADPNLYQNGNITWGRLSTGYGEAIAPDPTGSGTVFRYQYPYLIRDGADMPLTPADFFEVNPVGTIPTLTNPNAPPPSSAVTGLLRAGDDPRNGVGQWLGTVDQGSYFAINPRGAPGNYQGMVMSSRAGRIYRVSNARLSSGVGGIVWQNIGDPTSLDGSYAPAVAFGAFALGATNLDDFIYAGTLNGNVFVTTTGGGTSWRNITPGTLDNTPVLTISADPAPGSHRVFAQTQTAVYYCTNSLATTPVWVRLNDTGGKTFIFPGGGQRGIQRPVWNNPNDLAPAFNPVTGLTTMAVDWRYDIPDNLANPGGPKHPVLYVGGDGGVVRSLDLGTNWTVFPNNDPTKADSGPQAGGYLPEVRVTDLKLILGNVNPVTGVPDTSTGLNSLVASTLGRGDFSIRINDVLYKQFIVIPNSGPQVVSMTPIVANFGQALTGFTVTFRGAVDPTSFAPSKVESVTDPNGTQIPVAFVFDVTPVPPVGTGSLHNIYQVLFNRSQTTAGNYTLRLGVNITDFSGNLMNQNGNTVNGEVGTIGQDDRFQGTFNFLPNLAPIIGPIPMQLTRPGTPITVSFTVSDPDEPAAGITVTPAPTSSNTALVPNANIVVGGSGANRTLTITPVGTTPGIAFITVSITDAFGLSDPFLSRRTFELIVDNPPTMPTVASPQATTHLRPFVFPNFNVVSPDVPPLPLTTAVTAVTVSPAYNLWLANMFFQSGGSYFQNSSGMNEKWIRSQTSGNWYIIEPSGKLSVWNGGSSFTQVAQFDNSYWQDPTLLTAPGAPFNVPASIGLPVGNTLAVAPPINYVGDVNVTISTTDGFATTTVSFVLHVTNAGAHFNTIPDQTIPPTQANLVIDFRNNLLNGAPFPLNLVDPDEPPPEAIFLAGSKMYAANPAGIAYQLSQTLSLYFTGNYFTNAAGLNERWVRSLSSGVWYIIQPSGAFSRWEGGSTFTPLATLDSSFWSDPTLLVQAAEPPPLAGLVVDDVNHTVTVTPSAPRQIVKIAAFDGQSTFSQFFTLSVPVIAPTFAVLDQQFVHNASTHPQLTMNLNAAPFNLVDNNGFALTTSVAVFDFVPAKAYDLSTSLNLQFGGSYFQDSSGRGERWLFGVATNKWYIIEPNGNFSLWNGGSSFTLIATLNFSYWNNPGTLINSGLVAPTPLLGPIDHGTATSGPLTLGVTGNTLTFDTNGSIATNYFVSVRAFDPLSSTTHSFELSVSDVGPTFNLVIPPGSSTIGHNSTYTIMVNGIADPEEGPNAPVFSASVYPFVPGFAYELQQTYRFYTTGSYYSSGTSPKWFRSAVNNGWYTIDMNGLVSSWNGGNSFTPLDTLDATYYADPTRLFGANTPPADLSPGQVTATFVGSDATGYNLTIAPNGAVDKLLVRVKAADSIALTSQYFSLTSQDLAPTFGFLPNISPTAEFGSPAGTGVSHQVHTFTLDLMNPFSFIPPWPSSTLQDPDDPTASLRVAIKAYLADSAAVAYRLQSDLGLFFTGSYAQNATGQLNEKWLRSAVDGTWYIIEPDGKVSSWNGTTVSTSSFTFWAQLDASYYNDPTRIFAATEPADALGLMVNGHRVVTSYVVDNATHRLTVNTDPNFAGDLMVKVTATDPPGLSTTRFFRLSLTGQAPTLTVRQPGPYTLNRNGTPLTLNLDATDPDSGDTLPLTYNVTVTNPPSAQRAYDLQQSLHLFVDGSSFFNYYGFNEIWFRSAVNSAWYAMTPDGTFYLLDPQHLLGTVVATLDPSYYTDPQRLLNAQPPGTSVPVSFGLSGPDPGFPDGKLLTLTCTNSSFTGPVFVTVTVTNSIGLSTTRSFTVNVA
jgi:subtilisin-like proprotein convertase family protein